MKNLTNNLFTTSDPPKIRIPILQIFVFVIEGGQENIFSLVQKIFSTNKKKFSCPPSITKTKIWRIGIRIFGGSDVVNKLFVSLYFNLKSISKKYEFDFMLLSRDFCETILALDKSRKHSLTYFENLTCKCSRGVSC